MVTDGAADLEIQPFHGLGADRWCPLDRTGFEQVYEVLHGSEGLGPEGIEAFPTATGGGDEAGLTQDSQMLAYRRPCHGVLRGEIRNAARLGR